MYKLRLCVQYTLYSVLVLLRSVLISNHYACTTYDPKSTIGVTDTEKTHPTRTEIVGVKNELSSSFVNDLIFYHQSEL